MTDYAEFRVYVDWDNNGNYSGTYDEITDDVAAASLIVGIDDPKKRVANVGTLTLTVNNSDRKYSPRYSSSPLYGKLLPARPVRVIEAVIGEEVSFKVLFEGVIVSINPGSQRFGERYATIECRDKVGVFQAYNQLAVPLQLGKTADELLRLIGSDVYSTDKASAVITLSEVPSNDWTFAIGDTTYRWRNTLSAAYDVKIGASAIVSATNLRNAINAGPGAGTTYHASTLHHPEVTAHLITIGSDALLYLEANARGAWANGIAVIYTTSGGVGLDSLTGGVDGPATVDYETGLVTFEYACDTWTPGETNALTAIEEVVNSEFGYWWVSQDGTPTFRNKDWFLLQGGMAPAATLVEQQSGLDGLLTLDDTYNVVAVTFQPRRTLAEDVIAHASGTIEVPGATPEANRWNASDPQQEEGTVFLKLEVSDDTGDTGGVLSVILPVPVTDYTVEDDAGFDYTSLERISISMAVNGNTIELTLGNSATGPLFVHDLQIRGVMLKKSDAQQVIKQDATSIAAYGKLSPLTYELPLATSVTFASSVAAYLLGRYKDPQYRIDRLEMENPIADEDLFVDWFALDIGDVILLTEYQTATSNRKFMIRSVEADFEAGQRSRLAFGLLELEDNTYWILGQTGLGELGTNTRLGI